ncbi:hypothetical protein ACCS93_36985 [Rhizobium ruizarguesonis]
MSRKSVQRFCDNGMRKNKELKRDERIRDRDALWNSPRHKLADRAKNCSTLDRWRSAAHKRIQLKENIRPLADPSIALGLSTQNGKGD